MITESTSYINISTRVIPILTYTFIIYQSHIFFHFQTIRSSLIIRTTRTRCALSIYSIMITILTRMMTCIINMNIEIVIIKYNIVSIRNSKDSCWKILIILIIYIIVFDFLHLKLGINILVINNSNIPNFCIRFCNHTNLSSS